MGITATRIHNLVLTPVKARTPVAGLFIGYTVVDLLYKALEVGKVLKGCLRVHVGVWCLVQVVRT